MERPSNLEYGTKDYNSMHLLAKCFAEYPEHAKNIVLAIKGGINKQGRPDGTREGARRSVDNLIRTLDGEMTLDIFEYARVVRRPLRRWPNTSRTANSKESRGLKSMPRSLGGRTRSRCTPSAALRSSFPCGQRIFQRVMLQLSVKSGEFRSWRTRLSEVAS